MNASPSTLAHTLLVLALLAGCAGAPSPAERRAQADALAAARGWQRIDLPAGRFTLAGYLPAHGARGEELTVYIEGDGFAWASRTRPSLDPTPRQPVALQLAQPTGAAAYLARPCQYRSPQDLACNQRYWTGARFAPEVIDAASLALDALVARTGARRLLLVGYSGGGAVATLLAARRSDVRLLVTVAGNLDHRSWTAQQGLSPLRQSLNPAEQRTALQHLPQWHLAGGRDDVVPADIARAFIDGLPAPHRARRLIVPEFDHHCCWVQQWPALWRQLSASR